MSALLVFFWVVTGAAFLDVCRRPSVEWVAADRNRAFWLVMLVVLNIVGAVFYLLLVVPQFPREQQVDSAFLKSSQGDTTTIERKLR
jgi:predicted PurR-regulated permease PerM